jgi:ribosomal protein S18 acetylase RimI-like enzyme
VIAVDPSYQRRGIGKMLLEYGLNGAADQGKDIYLLARAEGIPLYKALEFEALGTAECGVTQTLMLKTATRN